MRDDEQSYEQKVEQLEEILKRLDEASTPIDTLARDVKRGARLIRELEAKLQEVEAEVRDAFAELEAAGRNALARDAGSAARWHTHRRVALRYRGTETALDVGWGDPTEMREEFETLHRSEFGYVRPDHVVEAATLRVAVEVHGTKPALPRVEPGTNEPERATELWSEGALVTAPVYRRENFPIGVEIPGPALVLDATGTIVIDVGFAGVRERSRSLRSFERLSPTAVTYTAGRSCTGHSA